LLFVFWDFSQPQYTKKQEAKSTRDVTKDTTNVTFWGEKVVKVFKVS